jgi:hypothetical protein
MGLLLLSYYAFLLACAFGDAQSIQQAAATCWAPVAAECGTIGCVHSVPLGLPQYPLSQAMLARSIPYATHDRRLHGALERAQSGQPITIVVIGGSVTQGHACTSDVTGRSVTTSECSWVSRFTEWARARFPTTGITVRNGALSACNSLCQLPQLSRTLPRDQPADIVVIDVSSNDAMALDFSRGPGFHEGETDHCCSTTNQLHAVLWKVDLNHEDSDARR